MSPRPDLLPQGTEAVMGNRDDNGYEHRDISTNGIRLHVVLAGPTDGTPVVLLHGFPEFWYSWRKQIPFLAAQGFRVWVPDLRGYNLSDKPEGIRAYHLPTLVNDLAGLIRATGSPSVALVGHDWGATVAWQLAAQSPELVQRMAILNVPHPAIMMRALRRNPRQMLRSWYIAFFQLPWLPELLVRPMLARVLRRTSRPGTFSDADLALYRQAWAVPGAITAMLNWCRALRYASQSAGGPARIRVPTLLIWGARDHALCRELAQPSVELCDHGRLEFIESATHWVQHEEPALVNELLDSFQRQAEDVAEGRAPVF